jgi:hypothetical protein
LARLPIDTTGATLRRPVLEDEADLCNFAIANAQKAPHVSSEVLPALSITRSMPIDIAAVRISFGVDRDDGICAVTTSAPKLV